MSNYLIFVADWHEEFICGSLDPTLPQKEKYVGRRMGCGPWKLLVSIVTWRNPGRGGVMRGTYELRRLENVLTAGQWPEWNWLL
jgi:hypothetical protein